jgi:hypothetical protein
MEWTAIAGGLVAVLTGLNLLVSLRTRADVAEVKLEVSEKMVERDDKTREWAEREFERKDVVTAKIDALRAARG